MVLIWILVNIVTLVVVKADYDCLCNYKVEIPVNAEADRDSAVLGYLYEFDCKPTVKVGGLKQNWQTIAYEKQVGYVYSDAQVHAQICPGKPSIEDILTTTTSRSTTPTTTTVVSTSTQKTTKTTTTTSTTTLTTITTSPTTTRKITTTQPTTTKPTTTVTTTTTRVMPTSTVGHTVSTSASPVMLGDVKFCPHTLHQYTIEDQGALGKFGDSCYEIVPIQTTWLKAEKDCTAKGGHLFHVSNQREEDFILLFINSNKFAHACWMGLHDLIQEEMFEWTSGNNLTYTNWWHDRKGNFFSHHTEDCVLFVPFSPYFGKWDDVPCGSTTAFGIDQGQTNPFICQFSIHKQYTYVPLSSGLG